MLLSQRPEVSTQTIQVIRGLEHPANLTELQSSLGLCNVFCRLVQKLAVATPLNKKLRNGQPQTFDKLSNDEITALERLKIKLANPVVLELSLWQGDYTVDTDACDKQIGCDLLQEQPGGTDRPIRY